jgi:hypothetical protein
MAVRFNERATCMSGIGNGTAQTIARWAAENPKVRRVWILGEARAARPDLANEVSWIDADGASRSISEVLDEPKVLVYDRSA